MDAAIWPVALGSTLAWAAFDAIRKALVGRLPVLALSFWVTAAQLPGFAAWAWFESSTTQGGLSLPEVGYWLPASAATLLYLVSTILFLEAVRICPLSTVIPILSLTPVFVAIGGIPLLGETLAPLQWVGVVMVSAGALLLTAPPEASRRPVLILQSFFRERGVVLMTVVAMMWALSPIMDKLALQHVSVSLHALLLAIGISLGLLVVLAQRRQLSTLPIPGKTLPLLGLGGLANVAAMGLQLVAVSLMVVSVFEAFKRAAGLLLAMGLGAIVFRERITLAKAVAGVVMSAGVGLVLV